MNRNSEKIRITKQNLTMKITPKKNPSIGFSGLLTLLFIGLKLTNHINWSWWWVLSPIAIQLTIVVLLIALVAILEKKWK